MTRTNPGDWPNVPQNGAHRGVDRPCEARISSRYRGDVIFQIAKLRKSNLLGAISRWNDRCFVSEWAPHILNRLLPRRPLELSAVALCKKNSAPVRSWKWERRGRGARRKCPRRWTGSYAKERKACQPAIERRTRRLAVRAPRGNARTQSIVASVRPYMI